jgi:ATP-dependent Zn protease
MILRSAKIFMYLLVVIIAGAIVMNYSKISSPVRELNYTEFKQKVEAGKIKEATFEDERTVRGTLNEGTQGEQQFKVTIPRGSEEALISHLEEHNIRDQCETSVRNTLADSRSQRITIYFNCRIFCAAVQTGTVSRRRPGIQLRKVKG